MAKIFYVTCREIKVTDLMKNKPDIEYEYLKSIEPQNFLREHPSTLILEMTRAECDELNKKELMEAGFYALWGLSATDLDNIMRR